MKRPRSTSMVRRVRLHRILSQDWKTAVISGPAGYGKTVLAAQFIGNRDAVVCRLRTGDARPVHLLGTILAAAAALRRPTGGRTLQLFAAHRDFERDGGLLTASLVQELIPEKGVRWIVIDDLHAIAHSPEALTWLRHLMEETGPSVRFLLVCRAECPIPLARFDLMGGSIIVKTTDLAFDARETASFLRGVNPRSMGALHEKQLVERLAGWPAGLALLSRVRVARAQRPPVHPAEGIEPIERDHVMDYLLQEVFTPLPPRLQRSLCRASLLEDLDGAALQSLMGRREADWMLREVRARDLFLDTGAGPLPRFQPLFRNALRRELRRSVGMDAERKMLGRLAITLRNTGRHREAIEAYLEAGEAHRAASLFEKAVTAADTGSTVVVPRIAQRIRAALDSKDSTDSIRYPRLLAHAANEMQMERRFGDAISCLRAARSRFMEKGLVIDAARTFRNEAVLATMTGTVPETVREARRILRALPQAESIARGLILLELGQFELHLGKPEAARRSLRSAASLLAGTGRDREIAQATERQAEVNFTSGQWDSYLVETTPVLRYYQRAGFTTRAQSLLINRAEALIYLGQEREALTPLDEAVALAPRSSAPVLRAHVAISRARAASEAGWTAEAVRLFRTAREIVDRYGSPFTRLQLDLWQGVFDRRRGKMSAAGRKLDGAREGFALAGSTSWEAITLMEGGLLRGLRGETERALDDLRASLLVTKRHGDRKEEAANLLYRAAVLRQADRPFLPSLLASLRILDRESYFVFLRKEARLSVPILEEALRRRPRTLLLGRALAALPETSRRPDGDASPQGKAGREKPGLPEPALDIRLLGGFELLRGSSRLVFPRRACEILIAHLCLRGRPVSREVLGEALWAGASAAASRNRFDVTLSTIRRILEPSAGPRGPFRILLSQSGHCRFAQGTVSLDVDRFERAAEICEPYCRRMRSAYLFNPGRDPRFGDADRALRELKAALDLHGGDLLAGRDLDAWLQAARERIEERHRDLLLAWGHYARLAGQTQEAIAAAESILTTDPFCESAMQLLLLGHISDGRRDAALTAYTRFSRRMTRELGAPPSPETQALMRPLAALETRSRERDRA